MVIEEIRRLVAGTADAAFAVDSSGLITAWNRSAEDLFGPTSTEVIGRPCAEVLQGTDECGAFCSEDCGIQHAAQAGCPVANFDLQVRTKNGERWCNVSVLIVNAIGSALPHAVHILRPREMQKRLELLIRDFLVTQTDLAPDLAARLISSRRSTATNAKLTGRETEILRMLATGKGTRAIAEAFHISRATVNNHVRHILSKLNAHSRLEAVRRAEHSRLI